jgi:membrane protein involved in colicin uptake
VVLVIAPNAATARWASRPIDLGGGNRYAPLVVGPDGVPKLTDPARARREPQLAVLSVMAHGRGELKTAAAIGAAAAKAIQRLSEEQRVLYSLLIEANLSEAARKAIEMQTGLEKFFTRAQRQNFERGRAEGEAKGKAEGEAKGKAEGEAKGKAEGEAKGKAEGEAKGKAEALLKIVTQRGLTLTAEQRRGIMGCTDVAMLERWLDRALSVSSVAELTAAAPRASRGRAGQAHGRRKSR